MPARAADPVDTTGTVLRVYREMLERTPDAAGLSSYAAQLAEGHDEAWLRRVLSTSPEYRKREAARASWRQSHVLFPCFWALVFAAYAWGTRRPRIVRLGGWVATITAGALYFGLIARYAVNIPVGDDFDSILAWSNKPASVRFAHLADFNNEHRIVASRLLVEGVRAATGAVDFKLMTVAMNLSLPVLLIAIWRELRRWPATQAWFPLVPLLLFSPMSWFNMTQGTPYALVAMLVFLAFRAVRDMRSWLWIPVSLALVSAATLSMLPGFLAFPLLPLAAALRRLDPQRNPAATWRVLLCRGFLIEVVALVAAGIAFGLLYFRGCPSPTVDSGVRTPFSLLAAIPFTLRFAGAFAGGAASLWVGIFFLGVLMWATYRRGWARSPVFFLMAVFIFLNGAAAAYARMPLGFSPEDFRYRIYPLLLAVCTIGLLAEFAPAWLQRRSALAAAGGWVVVIYALSVVDNVPRLEQRRGESVRGTAAWVRGDGGPCYPRAGRAYAGKILAESIRQGIYVLPDEVVAWARETPSTAR